MFGKEVGSIERVGPVADASGEVQYPIDMSYDEHNAHFHAQVLARDVGGDEEEPALVAASFSGYSNYYTPYYYLVDGAYCGLGVSSSMSYEKQYRAVVFLDDNRALVCDVSCLVSDTSSKVEDYVDSVVAELLISSRLSNCAEILNGDNLPQGYLTLGNSREMADTRLEQENEGAE